MLVSVAIAVAETYPRVSSADGSVISRKVGEEIRFIDLPAWRSVNVNQDLLAGDTLRTNAAGSLAIRFADDTVVRMGRNTTLLVRKIDAKDNSELELQSGSIWARAGRGGSGLSVDTPAAAAAIRGTDWTLRVHGGETTLTVLEGKVELFNPHGTVTVDQGEGATATIGRAPRKYILVDLKEREQILLYSELRGAFSGLPVGGLDGKQMRAERQRILEIAPAARTPSDWLRLAEASLSTDGRAAAGVALAHLLRPLDHEQEARAKLVEAMIAGQGMHYAEAERLFSEALPHLPPSQKATAAYGRWFATSLAEPDRQVPPPSGRPYAVDAAAAMAEATVVAHMQGQAEAIEVLRKAERRFPYDARLPAMRAGLAYELDRRDEIREALERARSLDPQEPTYLLTNARFRSTLSSDLDGALVDLNAAAAVAPGADDVWNEIGIVQSDRNAILEADAAHRKAIALNPENPVLYANYARFLMDNDQVVAAKEQIDAAERLDPKSYAVLAAKGRYLLRIGKTAEGEKALLDASAVNPTYGDALIGLAIANYQMGADEESAQALDNADRFDRDNPSIPLVRSGIALDEFRADDAIREAREALRRRQVRGGYYSGYDSNRQAASFLGVTLENLALTEWGQFYADRAYDPFKSSSYIDEAASGRLSPFVGEPPNGIERFPAGGSSTSSLLQGLLLDPLAVASEAKRNSLERRSFFEAALGTSFLNESSGAGWGGDLLLQGTSYAGFPLSYYIQGEVSRPETARDNNANDFDGGLFQLGLRPTLADSMFLFGNDFNLEEGYPGQTSDPAPFNEVVTHQTTIGGAWSHTISDRNVIQIFAVSSDTDTRKQFRSRVIVDDVVLFTDRINQNEHDGYEAIGASHLFGIGPFSIRYGAEAANTRFSISEKVTDVATGVETDFGSFSGRNSASRVYIDSILEMSNDLQFQGGAYMTRFDGDSGLWGPVDPRIGVSWSPVENHLLRAYYRQDTQFITDYTLAPISTVGLSPLELDLFSAGQTRTTALRWDAEWNERFFTSVEYQHQHFNGLSLAPEDLLTTFLTSDGEIDRLNLSANYWIGGGLGAFASFTWNESKDETPFWNDDFRVPLIPDYVGQIGLNYVHPSRVTATIAQTFVGPRVGSQYHDFDETPVAPEIERYTTTDAAVTWKSESGHLELGLQALNIFDAHADMIERLPAPGRTLRATLRARF
ncbi:FecR domain-containing protein [Rhizobium giardinii]|uniref:FecR domain-containing protein n=1 Tax=Rhizobium giardinii TaxID=56731 RepID=UPI0039E0CC61